MARDPLGPRGGASINVTFGDKPDVIVDAGRSIGVEIANLYHFDGERLDSEQH